MQFAWFLLLVHARLLRRLGTNATCLTRLRDCHSLTVQQHGAANALINIFRIDASALVGRQSGMS